MLKVWRALFVLALGVTLYATLTPLRGQAPGFPGLDKIVHLLLFAQNAVFGVLSFPTRGRSILLASLLVLGVVLELAQGYVPTRSSSAADALANGLGVLVGGFIAVRLTRSGTEPT